MKTTCSTTCVGCMQMRSTRLALVRVVLCYNTPGIEAYPPLALIVFLLGLAV